jgi:hypothetical protein
MTALDYGMGKDSTASVARWNFVNVFLLIDIINLQNA